MKVDWPSSIKLLGESHEHSKWFYKTMNTPSDFKQTQANSKNKWLTYHAFTWGRTDTLSASWEMNTIQGKLFE